ncbi:MAG: hypothetical protein AAF598_19265 [Bacteroidota bacterium]
MPYITPNLPIEEFPESPGNANDLSFIEDGGWLLNTEVRYLIQERRSRWHVYMVFVAVENPMKLICRHIDSYHSIQKAETFAKIFQRGIRKDARGTLKSDVNAFNICNN